MFNFWWWQHGGRQRASVCMLQEDAGWKVSGHRRCCDWETKSLLPSSWLRKGFHRLRARRLLTFFAHNACQSLYWYAHRKISAGCRSRKGRCARHRFAECSVFTEFIAGLQVQVTWEPRIWDCRGQSNSRFIRYIDVLPGPLPFRTHTWLRKSKICCLSKSAPTISPYRWS